MKTTITNYTFNKTNRTIDLSTIPGFDIKRLLAILNATTKQMMYAVAQIGLGYSNISGSVITLERDTSSMDDSDELTILYDLDVFTETDISGNITTGGVSQQLLNSDSDGRYVRIINLASDILWINTTGTAVIGGTGSMPVRQYGSIEFPYKITNAINIIGANTGHSFTAKIY